LGIDDSIGSIALISNYLGKILKMAVLIHLEILRRSIVLSVVDRCAASCRIEQEQRIVRDVAANQGCRDM